MTTAVVVPVHRNARTLEPLHARLTSALQGRAWRLRIVVDASPDDSGDVAAGLAAADPRVGVTVLPTNVGQHRALAVGLAAEPDADAWVCLDADLQDPPEAVPLLLARLERGDVQAVFAGRRGSYEGPVRLLTGRLHRAAMARLTGLPPDAGAFLALRGAARSQVLRAAAPSLVAAIGAARLPVASVPVRRDPRGAGRSSWTGRARTLQSLRALVWSARHR